jgi:hypothetical protein
MRRLQQTLKRVNLRSNRVATIRAIVFLLLGTALAVVVYNNAEPMVPIINDVCTDLDNPVEFTQNTELNPFPEAFKAQVKAGYPDLKPLTVRPHIPRSEQL